MIKKGFTLIEMMVVIAIIATISVIAIPSLMRSRIASNQTSAVASCKSFAEAEEIYHRSDYNTDGVLEYSQRLRGDWSLYECSAGLGDLSIIAKHFAYAEGLPSTGAVPKAGYVFQVLTAQGSGATGGARTYMKKKRMILGYALSALPGWYDGTGRSTYCINNNGTIFQLDQGSPGSQAHLTIFNPTPGLWAGE